MKRRSVPSAVGVLFLLLLATSAVAAPAGPARPSVAGEVLVKLQAGASQDDIAGLERAGDVSHSERIAELRSGALWRMRSRSKNVDALVAALQKNPKVDYAEPNYLVEPSATPNDPQYAQLWALKSALSEIDIQAEAAWNVTTGSKSIVVGIVDTGVNYLHPDLAPNMWRNPGGKGNAACGAGTYGYNARARTCDPMDDHYHGSHVAGTIGAAGNNGLGVAGINWNVSLMALKFLGNIDNSSGNVADAIAAIDFAIQARIDGVNVRVLCNSWGGSPFSKALLDIINKANEHDILFVAAAGNNATDNDLTPHYPSSYQTLNMLAVAATDPNDQLASFSNWGANGVHLGAPGVGIYSTALGEGYVSLNGTSMAAPHVAGVAALVLAKTPAMTTAQLRSTLLESGDPIKSLAGKTTTGRRLNAAKAVGAPPLPGFRIALGPSAQLIQRGATATYSVTVQPVNGFTGPVALTVSGVPEGATATFSPASTSTTSTLTVTTSSTTPLGYSELSVAAEGGGLRRTTWAGLTAMGGTAPPASCPSFAMSARYDVGAATGVALGDFNRDGRTDLASVSHDRNTLSVLLGHGNETFRAPVAYAVGIAPMAVTAADLNGDGKLDLAVANAGSTTISLLLGNGDGTFQAAVQHQAGANPFGIAAGDFNRDGRSDLAVANNGASSVTILLGNGNGTFAAPVHYAAGSGPYSVAVGDADGDGDPDLAVAAYHANGAAILLNAGNGTFAATSFYAAGTNPSGVAFADFDRDGALDLTVSNYAGGRSISVLKGNGNGTFGAPLQYPGDAQTNFVATGDFNADGRTDIAAASTGGGTIAIYHGNGNGTFQDPAYTAGFGEPSHMAVADVNGDGRDDVAVADLRQFSVAVLFNTGACTYNCGTFTAGSTFPAGTTPDAAAAADFNGDGRPDLAVANDGGVSIRTGTGNGTFAAGANISAGSDPDAVAAGDFNGDGNPDLAVANEGSNDVSVAIGNGDGTFAGAVAYGAGTNPRAIAAGDFDRDGRLDLAVANRGSNDVSLLPGNGNGTFRSASQLAAGTAPTAIVAADFDRDGRQDLAVANGGSNDVTLLAGNGDGTFRNATTAMAGTSPAAIVTADFNRDGKGDLAVANRVSNDVSVLLGNGDGTFQPAFPIGAGSAPAGLAAGDFNSDGLADLAVANGGSHDVSLLAGDGRGSFAAATRLEGGIGPAAAVASDFDGDGKSDLAVVNGGAGNVAILLNTCPRPDLTIAKTHSGSFAQGADGYTYTLTVRNSGAGATKNLVTVTDTLPAGLRATGMSGVGWTCSAAALSCTRGDVLAPGASYPPVTLTVSVAPNAAASLVNQAFVSGGGDASAGNNSASDATSIVAITDLVVSLTHAGSFTQGATGRTYSLVARNAGGLATSGTVTVSQLLPAALTATAIGGTGWNCTLASLTCTRGDALAAGSSYPAVTVTVAVAADAPVEVVSTASVSGGNEGNAGNDTASDRTMIWSAANCGAFGGTVPYSAGSTPTALAVGDFTGDGRNDLAVANYYSSNVSVLAGRPDGTFAAAVHSPTGGQFARAIESADLNFDGNLDAVVVNYGSNDISVLLGNGNGTFAAPVTYPAGNVPHSLAIADFNSDGLLDVAVSNSYFGTISILLGKGGGAFQPRVDAAGAISASLAGLAVSDFNGDGVPDLAAASDYGGVWRYSGNGDGSFRPPVSYAAGGASQHVASGDFNRDGKADLAVPNQADGTLSILIGAGDGSFQAAVTQRLGFGVAFARVLDINGDGALDVLASSTNMNAIYTLRGNGDGTFQTATSMTLGGAGQFFVADFNGDSRPDIATVNGTVSVVIGGCADLTVAKTHTGNFNAGQNGTYVVTVTNAGKGSTQGTVTVVDTLPAGMTVTSMSGAGWTCDLAAVTCTRTDSRIPNVSYTPLYIGVSVGRTAPGSVTNTVRVSGGGEVDTANNVANDPTTIVHAADLKVTATHAGNFAQEQTGRVYTVTVGNIGSAPTQGAVTLTDNIPLGLTLTAMSGAGWTCTVATRSCTREDALAIDASYPPITVTVDVAADAQLSVTNYFTAAGGGDVTPDNNSIGDWTTILATPSGVAAAAASPSQINVSWKAVQYATSYRVLRGTSAEGPFALAGSPLSNSFLDSSLEAGKTYYYRVQAADQTILTSASATASATTSTGGAAPSGATGLYILTPCRLLDTRDSTALGAGAVQVVPVTGACGIPAGAKSVIMNITAVLPGAPGSLTAYPSDATPVPDTVALSYRTGKTRAGNAIIKLSDDGRLSILNRGSAVHFIIDVTGYFQ
jgi:uncharacterized repeat protein (TIGR01451 family)